MLISEEVIKSQSPEFLQNLHQDDQQPGKHSHREKKDAAKHIENGVQNQDYEEADEEESEEIALDEVEDPGYVFPEDGVVRSVFEVISALGNPLKDISEPAAHGNLFSFVVFDLPSLVIHSVVVVVLAAVKQPLQSELAVKQVEEAPLREILRVVKPLQNQVFHFPTVIARVDFNRLLVDEVVTRRCVCSFHHLVRRQQDVVDEVLYRNL